MRISTAVFLGAAIMASPALAQTAPAKNNAAIKNVHTVNDGGSRRGANSFTEGQAREHIAKSGFTNVSSLTKDANGVWRGTAMRSGHKVQVGLDFKGNVSTGM